MSECPVHEQGKLMIILGVGVLVQCASGNSMLLWMSSLRTRCIDYDIIENVAGPGNQSHA